MNPINPMPPTPSIEGSKLGFDIRVWPAAICCETWLSSSPGPADVMCFQNRWTRLGRTRLGRTRLAGRGSPHSALHPQSLLYIPTPQGARKKFLLSAMQLFQTSSGFQFL